MLNRRRLLAAGIPAALASCVEKRWGGTYDTKAFYQAVTKRGEEWLTEWLRTAPYTATIADAEALFGKPSDMMIHTGGNPVRQLIVHVWDFETFDVLKRGIGIASKHDVSSFSQALALTFAQDDGLLRGSSYRRRGPRDERMYVLTTLPLVKLAVTAAHVAIINWVVREAIDDGLRRLKREAHEEADELRERLEREIEDEDIKFDDINIDLEEQ